MFCPSFFYFYVTFPHVINNYLVNHILDALDSLVWFFVYLIKF